MILTRTAFLSALASISIGAGALRAETGAAADGQAESQMTGAVSSEELAALANDVNLPAWTRMIAGREFTTIEEGWVSVYSPKDSVGAAQNWSVPVAAARSLASRANEATQKRWLGLFIKAGEALNRKDAAQFSSILRALENDSPVVRIAGTNSRNFFTAK